MFLSYLDTMKSWVWNYYDKSEDGKSANCKLCDSTLQTHGSTTTLSQHLKRIHSLINDTPQKRNRVEEVEIANDVE